MKAKIILPLILILILNIFPTEVRLYNAGQCIGNSVSCPTDMSQLDAYTIVVERQPWRTDLWAMAGKTAYLQENWGKAKELLSTAAEKGALDRQGRQMLAEVYLNLGETDTGIAYMQSLMEEEQLPAQDYRELYRLLLAQLRVVEAEEAAV
ncbi:MAG: hypothetical protein V2J07_11005, partial [Anaerolineae bacterium]|nr:hypothetical protein [Anaerolineae bacterium]